MPLASEVAVVASRSDALLSQRRSRSRSCRVLLEIASFVADFIRERALVVYGGQAIDLALRAAGADPLYDDSALPDWDFYSAEHAADTYELADRLAVKFGRRFRAHRAKHVQTLRVRSDELSDDTVADISFLPPALFAFVPTLARDGVRFVHPHWQFADQHLSLGSPYRRFPGENVFFRWAKEVARHRMLHELYPPPEPPVELADAAAVAVPSPARLAPFLLGGLTAVVALAAAEPQLAWPPFLVELAARFRVTPAGIALAVPAWHCEPELGPHADVIVDELDPPPGAAFFRAAMDVAWPAVMAPGAEGGAYVRYAVSSGALVPFASFAFAGAPVRVAGPQVLLKQLAYWASARREPRYWAFYAAVHRHVTAFGGAGPAPYWTLDGLLAPANLLGTRDVEPSDEFLARSLRSRLDQRPDAALASVPASYTPSVRDGRVVSEHPSFVPAAPWFDLDGGAVAPGEASPPI